MTSDQKQGYQLLADLMAWDSNLAIFSRFRSANMLCLLHMQAEISDLEERLETFGYINNQSPIGKRNQLCYDWSVLKELSEDSPEKTLLRELKESLAQYNQALSHQISYEAQTPPRPRDLTYLRYWLEHAQGGANALRGPGSMTWSGIENQGRSDDDLIAIRPSSDYERTVAKWMLDLVWPVLRHLPKRLVPKKGFGPKDKRGKQVFRSRAGTKFLRSLADQMSSFIATTLILIPVIVLHFVTDANLRLVIIVAFSIAFQGLMVLATEAKRSEIFAATAAFVAVQVVYVGNALGSG